MGKSCGDLQISARFLPSLWKRRSGLARLMKVTFPILRQILTIVSMLNEPAAQLIVVAWTWNIATAATPGIRLNTILFG